MRYPELYPAQQCQAIDRYLIEHLGIDGYSLMDHAGAAAYAVARARWPEAHHLDIYCGGGNNGGDGWVIARLARRDGLRVRVISLSEPQALSGDAARAAQDYLQAGGDWLIHDQASAPHNADLIIDALLGTGLKGPPRADCARLIEAINHSGIPVLAVDIPSGLNADSGEAYQPCIRAAACVTFIARKAGLYTGAGPAHCGELVYRPLVEPLPQDHGQQACGQLVTSNSLRSWLPQRRPDAHKGQSGHVLIAGGNRGMGGAALLAGNAALRSGAGLVSVLTHDSHAGQILIQRPELMSHGWNLDQPWPADWLQRADIQVLGPGLGQDEWGAMMFQRLIDQPLPTVVDADGLNLLARQPRQRDHWLLTPHPGEAARLLNTTTAAIQADRIGAAREIAARYHALVVLKGAGSLIANPDGNIMLCPVAVPAMATAGLGDVLSGVLGALFAQAKAAGIDLWQATGLAVCAHAEAGRRAAGSRQRGLIASDVIDQLADVLS